MQRNKTPLHGTIELITIAARGSQHKITMEEIDELHAEQHGEERTDRRETVHMRLEFFQSTTISIFNAMAR
ncbi:hypothetical protein C5S53_15775 [Methanophagales archaeon]|jgi:hypothetical protein|nr:hypothetical protein C5S53_15775 [Methanophagales archaeon]